jgi:hypothetical protein
MGSVNATGPILIGQVNGPTRVLVLTLHRDGSQYENTSSVIQWPLAGLTQYYPFDSYRLDVSVQDNSLSFSNGTIGAYAHLTIVTSKFCGDNVQTLESTWHLGPQNSTAQSSSPKPVHDEGTVVITKNDQWGLVIMLPIWVALALAGLAFALDLSRLSDRLAILMALFIFAPVYHFTILGQSPPSPIYNLPEAQTTFLMVAILFEAIASVTAGRTFSVIRQVFFDGIAIVGAEVIYVILSGQVFLLGPSPSVVYQSYEVGIGVYFISAVLPLISRSAIAIYTPQRSFFLRVLFLFVPFWAGTVVLLLGFFLFAIVPTTGISWIIGGALILGLYSLLRRSRRIQRIITARGDENQRIGIW